jgi:hypothetical protein
VVGGNALQTIIDGGALAARKRAAQAGLEQADAQYRSTVIGAFRNVADTLRALEYDALTLRAAVAAEQATSTSLAIARRRLELGDTTYIFVLDRRARLSAGVAAAGAGAGGALHRYCSAVPGAGRRLVEPRPAEADLKAGPPRCRPPASVTSQR